MRYYIIAGEASGDLHGSNLMRALKQEDPDACFRFWGGDLMATQGGTPVRHYRDLAFMGFAEVIRHLPRILQNLSFCKADILSFNPDALILIDYPGFNLRIAGFAHAHNLRVFYYISPQVWAWKSSRVKKIRAAVDRLFVILPFEKEFYQRFNYETEYVGHPLLDVIPGATKPTTRTEFLKENNLADKPIVALLPGSRRMEIPKMLMEMAGVRDRFPQYQFVVAGAPSLDDGFYHRMLAGSDIRLVRNQTYELLRHSDAALVTSGTATLETALWNVPQVVCYKGNWISFQIARRLVKINFISLVNLIAGREVVKELIQTELNRKNLAEALHSILSNISVRKQIQDDYVSLRSLLGGEGASARTAKGMVQYLKKFKV
jgi:lipid-A-disaccharide synthase